MRDSVKRGFALQSRNIDTRGHEISGFRRAKPSTRFPEIILLFIIPQNRCFVNRKFLCDYAENPSLRNVFFDISDTVSSAPRRYSALRSFNDGLYLLSFKRKAQGLGDKRKIRHKRMRFSFRRILPKRCEIYIFLVHHNGYITQTLR